MKQAITIGDQKFVWSEEKKAWVDEKTGTLANQGLQSLLEVTSNSMFHNAANEVPKAEPTVPQAESKPVPEKPTPKPKPEKPSAETKTPPVEPSYNGEPVNIGGQKFILDEKKGWVDSKTKQPPSKDVIKLLEKITGVKSTALSDVTDKIEIEPIIIGGEKYIWDPKKGEWLNAKTKQRADDALQKLLTTTINKAGITKLDEINPTDLGSVGEAAKEKIKTQKPKKGPAPSAKPVESKKTKSLLVNMIKKLKSIDESFKTKSDIIAQQNVKEYAEARENIIEQQNNQAEELDNATKVGGSSIGRGLGIAAVIGIVAMAFQPVKESLKTAYEYIKSAYDTTNWLFDTLSDGFNRLLNLGKSNKQESTEASSATPETKAALTRQESKPVETQSTANKKQTFTSGIENPEATQVKSTASASPIHNVTAVATESTPQSKPAMTPASTNTDAKPVKPSKPRSHEASPRKGWYKGSGTPVADAKSIMQQMFPQARITSHRRKAGKVGKAGSKSWHVKSGAAIDIAPISGMSFDQWLQAFRNAGYSIIEAIDETIPANRKLTGGTGPHWHLVLGQGGKSSRVDPSRPNAGETYSQPDNSTDYVSETLNSETPYEAMINMVKGITQTLRVLGKTDSYYLGNLEEMTAKKTNRIGEISAQKYADMVYNNTVTEEDLKPMIMELPNINQNGGSTVQTPSTSNDKRVVGQYLQYFGFNTKIFNV